MSGGRLCYLDGRFHRDGEPFFVVASDYQYFRERRDVWRDRLEKLRAMGINTISVYVPWRHHQRGGEDGGRSFDFSGETKDSRDLVSFLDLVCELGLFIIAKPGPFVHSELNIGGLPDDVSPSFAPGFPAALDHRGDPVVWEYDASELPAPYSARFQERAAEWLDAVAAVLAPHTGPSGAIIALQLDDETIFCTSNDPPWCIGYEESALAAFGWSAEDAPRPGGSVDRPGLSRRVRWAEHQWRYRLELHARYRRAFSSFGLPFLTNLAGITPPIEENVPGQEPGADTGRVPEGFEHLYADWWLAANRVESSADEHHFGFISWLGVAAYDPDAFARYVNTARRARGINLEENFGFARLYDERSKHAIVPIFQTLLSIAGGATGFDVYCGVRHSYWDDELDRVTRLGCATFPSDAPITEEGELTPFYHKTAALAGWWGEHGSALLACDIERDCGWLIHAPYAAVASWVPDETAWDVAGHDCPRAGYAAFEPFARSLLDGGYAAVSFELEASTEEQWGACRSLAFHSAFFLSEAAQERLAAYIEAGGRLFLSGELPEGDLEGRTCTRLREAVERGGAGLVYRRESWFSAGGFAATLAEHGLRPGISPSPGLRCFVHRGVDERFLFFFEVAGEAGEHTVVLEGEPITLGLGPRSCGVLRLRGGEMVAWYVKAENEVEGVVGEVRLCAGGRTIEGRGDFCSG
ncbi:MAG: beta-galactosidase [Planctomycetota bacterium]|jgi:beta-galactosidase|nr:beta-galactosidase [Planctomycetota bacterium]MDP6763797.1 beta-galactosidase [Planctomycetota bacterium]MDP6989009.1 beta-galactosidase [Planctomycetota bacterium]